MRIFTGLLVLFAFSLLFLASFGYVLIQEADPPIKLETLFTDDIERLKGLKALPTELNSLSQIELHGGTETAKSWLKEMRFPFHVRKDGTHSLEILVVDWTEGAKRGAMIQLNLVENKTGNMIWELGRTFILRDDSSTYYLIRNHLMNRLRH